MAAKLFFVLCVAVCAASAIPLEAIYNYEHEAHEAPAHYEFAYSVHDTHTGDIKQQKESRAGDAVHGSYSLVQPDGVHRIVEYSSDKVNGFNANVRYEGHPTEAPHVAKVIAPAHYQYEHAPKITYAAPKVTYVARKVAYAAPKVAYVAPKIDYTPKVALVAPKVYVAPKLAYTTAPVAKVDYHAPLTHVTFTSPAISYQH